nr:uncharacterized protein LOC112746936 [Arachis hypogaea]
MTPKQKPAMTEFSTETAARAMVLMCPARSRVMAPSEYWLREVKMAGPARYHSFLISMENSLKKSLIPFIGGMSSDFVVKTAAVSRIPIWFPDPSSGSLCTFSKFSITNNNMSIVYSRCYYTFTLTCIYTT